MKGGAKGIQGRAKNSLCKGLKAIESLQSISNGQKPGTAVALKLEKNLVIDAIKKIGRLGPVQFSL